MFLFFYFYFLFVADIGRELRSLWNSIENLATRKPAPLSDIPQQFLQNPRTDYAAYKKMATVCLFVAPSIVFFSI
jgi:hypothetical protein